MAQYIIDGQDSKEVFERILESKRAMALENFEQPSAVIISGDALLKVSAAEVIKQHFVELTDYSQVVVACRVSPKQKAEIVTFIRHKYPKTTTLAIGDGANDVNMITSANVGVGISGLEGQ